MIVANWPVRIGSAVAGVAIVVISSWLMGFDFDERGGEAFTTFAICAFIAVACLTCPFSDRIE